MKDKYFISYAYIEYRYDEPPKKWFDNDIIEVENGEVIDLYTLESKYNSYDEVVILSINKL